MNRLVRVSALALTIAALPVLAGCGAKNPFTPPVDTKNHVPNDTPLNDTPQNTMLRFQRAYQYQDIAVYTDLLTRDFRYTFSSQTDPTLVQQYGDTWGKDFEVESATHLLKGFVNSVGTYIPPATSITIQFTGDQYLLDPAHSDSTAFYFYVPVSNVSLLIQTPADDFRISAAHSFYLVRGDVALLDTGQQATSNRWYIHRWDDLSVPLASVLQLASVNARIAGTSTGSGTVTPATWGGVKDRFQR